MIICKLNPTKRELIVLDAINALDFTMLKSKMHDPVEGEGWNMEKIEETETLYRKFLFLNGLFLHHPTIVIVPRMDIDKFWHRHILDTRAYMQDCNSVFGEYLHHFPYFGLRGEVDKRNLESAYENTKQLFLEHFGDDLDAVPAFETASATVSGCGVSCGSTCTSGACSTSVAEPNYQAVLAN
ncbi:MAG: hypothetical protein Q8O99_07435 [bacterium]|nr:hypothetical protein [bacterium]